MTNHKNNRSYKKANIKAKKYHQKRCTKNLFTRLAKYFFSSSIHQNRVLGRENWDNETDCFKVSRVIRRFRGFEIREARKNKILCEYRISSITQEYKLLVNFAIRSKNPCFLNSHLWELFTTFLNYFTFFTWLLVVLHSILLL